MLLNRAGRENNVDRSHYLQQPDAELVRIILQSPGTRLESLCLGILFYSRYQDRLRRTAYAILHNRQDAEDAVAGGFIKAYRMLHRYEPAQPFFPWLYTVVRNVARKQSRCWYRRGMGPSAEVQPPVHPAYDIMIDYHRIVQRLPPTAQQTSRLWFQDGASYAEISRDLHLPVGTISSQLNRARRLLRREMELLE